MDMILTAPDSVDFPLWRKWVSKKRAYFSKVIVVWMQTNQGHDFREFIENAMKDDRITFLDSPPVVRADWRNVAVNFGLDHSDAQWVLFAEQDILPEGDELWSEIVQGFNTHDVMGWMDGTTRLHPGFLWAKRSVIDRTKRNFGIVPNELDHFALFYNDLVNAGAEIKLLPILEKYHFAGLTHNMTLARNQQKVHHKHREFRNYLSQCLASGVPLHDQFVSEATWYIEQDFRGQ